MGVQMKIDSLQKYLRARLQNGQLLDKAGKEQKWKMSVSWLESDAIQTQGEWRN